MALVVIDPKTQKQFVLDGSSALTMGRDEGSDFAVDDPSVSRKHVTFEYQGEQWQVRDEGSRNGTEVEGKRLQPGVWTALAANMRLRVGYLELEVRESAAVKPGETVATTEFAPEQFLPHQQDTVVARSFDQLASEVIYRAQAALYPGQPLENMLESLLHLMLCYVPANRAVVQLLDEQSGRAETALAIDTASDRPMNDALLSEGIRQRVLGNKRSLLIKDISADIAFRERKSIVTAGITSAVAAPIFDGNDILGILYAEVRRAGHQLGESDVAVVSLLASLAGPMLMAQQMVSALMQSEAALREENQALRDQLEARV